jgi:hypothetical protein
MVYSEKERAWRAKYRQKPETKAKQKAYMQKYNSRPEIRQKRREYIKNYMKEYWKRRRDKYETHKKNIAILNKMKDIEIQEE